MRKMLCLQCTTSSYADETSWQKASPVFSPHRKSSGGKRLCRCRPSRSLLVGLMSPVSSWFSFWFWFSGVRLAADLHLSQAGLSPEPHYPLYIVTNYQELVEWRTVVVMIVLNWTVPSCFHISHFCSAYSSYMPFRF